MSRAKYNYVDQKSDMRIICVCLPLSLGPVFWKSCAILDCSCRFLLLNRCLISKKHEDMISLMNDFEMVNCDIEMMICAYLVQLGDDPMELTFG